MNNQNISFDERDLDQIVNVLCDTAVEALRRYHQLSDLGPSQVPEYFIQSFIFDRLGDQFSMTMETNVTTLRRWDGSSADIPAEIQRIDLVLYDDAQPIKSEQPPKMLIEIKKHDKVGSDIYKLQILLPEFSKTVSGAAVGIIDALKWMDWIKEEPMKVELENKKFIISSDQFRGFTAFGYLLKN